MRDGSFAIGALALALAPCGAQAAEDAGLVPPPADSAMKVEPKSAAGFDVFASTDADKTQVLRMGWNLDWSRSGDEKFEGIRVERALFKPLGQSATSFQRVYARYADRSGAWSWSGQLGTDGHTALGAVNLVTGTRRRTELFVERDILETPRGVGEGIYYTFAGVAVDVPLTARDTATLVVGAQEFTGKNVRLHARANYVHVIRPEWGLSAQVRGRYFHSTKPGEFDYFSPRWYAEALPVLQLRRFSRGGWRYLAAAGYGAQRDAASNWRSSRYLNGQVSSPSGRPVRVSATLVYSNTPVGSGFTYDYLQGSLGLTTYF